MADPQEQQQQFSPQDIDDLNQIAQQLPANHPHREKINAAIRDYQSNLPAMQQQQEPSTYDKLTSPEDPGATAFDQKHPIMGKVARTLSSVGGTVMGLPGSIAHAVTDPETEEEKQQVHHFPLAVERLSGGRQVANAIEDYAGGKVSPGAAMSVLPEALGQGIGNVAGAEIGRAAIPKMAQFAGDRIPGEQIARTAGKMVANTDVTKPVKALSQIPEFWRQSSPEAVAHMRAMNDPMRVATRNAIQEGTAMRIPLRQKETSVPQPRSVSAPSVSYGGTQIPEPTPQAAPPPVVSNVNPVAKPVIASSPVPPVSYRTNVAAPEIAPKSAPAPPVRFSTNVAPDVEPRSAPVPPVRFGMKPMGGAGRPGANAPITFVPEPRPTFAGEEPNYMASVPRSKLGKAAMSRKPGAGTQMQQLGQPIIYIPSEADVPRR